MTFLPLAKIEQATRLAPENLIFFSMASLTAVALDTTGRYSEDCRMECLAELMIRWYLSPPGTGKTTVIVEIILQAIAQNKRVLLTSQTHQAVCNVLEKLHELNNTGQTSVSMVEVRQKIILVRPAKGEDIRGENSHSFRT